MSSVGAWPTSYTWDGMRPGTSAMRLEVAQCKMGPLKSADFCKYVLVPPLSSEYKSNDAGFRLHETSHRTAIHGARGFDRTSYLATSKS